MAKYNLINFESESEFARYAAEEFNTLAEQAIAERGRFNVALSGGRTPKPVWEALKTIPVDWSRVHIYWSDERYVPIEHPRSNAGSAKHDLLDHVPVSKAHIHAIETGLADPHECALRYAKNLEELRLDLVYLGIGTDGHTASLFPGISLPVNSKVAAIYVARQGEYRITLLPDAINQAREIRFLVSGPEKKMILEQVLQASEDQVLYPCQRIRSCPILAFEVFSSCSS
ncbi:MAG: 6-phosphogluconolactonase [Myxococcaceae bacterium]|nr:6-phosphogluconolactonase [Myxococcaceae bacterium]MBH2005780.1 6-phosphogluconolactonase [Myxococcaceae bacterium]